MAIDFSQVKAITIPEGSVKKIQINGVTVWENAPVLTSITLSGFTTSYNTYATFTFNGTVTAHYSNGSTAVVTSSCTHNTPNMTVTGTKAVNVSYTENGITVTTSYNITVSKAWRTIYNNSSGKMVVKLNTGKKFTKGGVPANINSHTEKIRINYTTTCDSGALVITTWSNGGSHATTDTSLRTKYTKTFTYDQGHDIVFLRYSAGGSTNPPSSQEANASWYRNGIWTGSVGSYVGGDSTWTFTVYKLEEYY